MAVTQYIGARYVPLFATPLEWSNANVYEPLTIVLHNGASYTSRQAVPVGIDIENEDYWALTGNYNAQVEQYRIETKQAVAHVDEAAQNAEDNAAAAKNSETNAADSATAAANSATAAKNSETNAADSATAAANSATAASASQTAAANSASAANTSETNAANSATAASASQTAAANSASAANTSETNAANSATSAANSATEAINATGIGFITGRYYSNTETIEGGERIIKNITDIALPDAMAAVASGAYSLYAFANVVPHGTTSPNNAQLNVSVGISQASSTSKTCTLNMAIYNTSTTASITPLEIEYIIVAPKSA